MSQVVATFFNVILGLLENTVFLISHVTNGESFPEPLSEEEEKIYIKRYKEGESEAEAILVNHNLRLVAFVAKKYSSTGKEKDDLISVGTIGLIKAVKTFDDRKGIKLSSYASRCIENEILMDIRSSKPNKREVSLQNTIGTDKDGNEICLMDILGTEGNIVLEEVDSKITIKKLYEIIATVLKDKDKKIIEMRYGLIDGKRKTQQEIAEIYGISRSYISRIEKRILKLLKQELNHENHKS